MPPLLFDIDVEPSVADRWSATVRVARVPVWSAVSIEAVDVYEATGKAIHMFADRLRTALEEPPEYDGE